MDFPSPLPPLYARWMAEHLSGPLPAETKATCQACPMLSGSEERPGPGVIFFDNKIKCCAYLPRLYNFLAGRILADDDPAAVAGRATVEARLTAGVAVTPLGLEQTRTFTLLYEHSSAAFGRNRALQCPHYLEETGGCGVWRHRESTCATWFCKHERGAASQAFWRESVHRLLVAVEYELARWCLLKLEVEEEVLRHLLAPPLGSTGGPIHGEELDGKIDAAEYRKNWGAWLGREFEFYRECGRLVSPLAWQEVLDICGPETKILAALTRHAYQRFTSGETVLRLQAGSFQLVRLGHDTSRLSTYSDFDPLDIPNPVLNVLHYFDGRPTSEVLAEITEKEGIHLEPDLVRKLADFQVLVPPTDFNRG